MYVCMCVRASVRSGPNLAHTHADSSRKCSGRNTNLPCVTNWGIGGGGGGG